MTDDPLRAAAVAVCRLWFTDNAPDGSQHVRKAMLELRAALAASAPDEGRYRHRHPVYGDDPEIASGSMWHEHDDREHPHPPQGKATYGAASAPDEKDATYVVLRRDPKTGRFTALQEQPE